MTHIHTRTHVTSCSPKRDTHTTHTHIYIHHTCKRMHTHTHTGHLSCGTEHETLIHTHTYITFALASVCGTALQLGLRICVSDVPHSGLSHSPLPFAVASLLDLVIFSTRDQSGPASRQSEAYLWGSRWEARPAAFERSGLQCLLVRSSGSCTPAPALVARPTPNGPAPVPVARASRTSSWAQVLA